ncbi:MAG: DUF4198 domain-containing protein [Gemmataceae bacterium]|nr:DUF4198 domain-containing protein [Gemmataceae bacterium]
MRTILIALCVASAARAHDFWLAADPPRPAAGAKAAVRLHIGDRFASEGEKPLTRDGTARFLAWHGGKQLDLMPPKSAKPAGVIEAAAGTCLVALDRAPRLITLEAAKFDAYLKEEGLEEALAEREKRGESKKPGRERYGRSIKLLFRAGGEGSGEWKRVVGQALEIVPLSDPTGLKPGDDLAVRLLEDGKPLAGARITAYSRQEGKVGEKHATTSSKGEATFRIGTAGPWLLRLVRMKRVKSKDADWESRWSALSFDVPGK